MIRLALLVLANVAGSAFCSLSEAALLASSEARIRVRAQSGNKRAERLLGLRQDPHRTLASIVFLNNIFAIAGTAFITSEATSVIHTSWGMGLFIAAQTVLIIAFGEIVPKVLGEAQPEPIAAFLSGPLTWVRRIMSPLVWLMQGLTSWARPRARVEQGQETEIRELALLGHQGGHLDADEAELIHRVFRLDDITAEDVMTPRPLVNGFPADATLADIQDALLKANHGQFPVYEQDLDTVVGALWLKDGLGALARNEKDRLVRDVMRTAQFIPPSRAVDDVLRDLQASSRRMLIVIDEYGATLGIITMDDLVEELVGEAIDETDVSEGLVKRISRNAAVVHGLSRVRDVARFLKCDVTYEEPDDETNTVTGLLQEHLERIPRRGDRIHLDPGLVFEVREADARMAVRVLARNATRATGSEASGASPRS